MEWHPSRRYSWPLGNCDDAVLLDYLVSDGNGDARRSATGHVLRCLACSAAARSADIPLDESDEALTDLQLQELFARRLRESSRNREGLQRIITACDTALQGNPDRALVLTRVAIEIADQSAILDLEVVGLGAIAWTRHASALKAIGRHNCALDAIEIAESRAQRLPAADLELALIAFTASHILREIGRTVEALDKIRGAIETFARYNDARRVAVSRELEATVLYRMGEHANALVIFEHLFAESTTDDARARLSLSAGHCAALLGQHEKAEPLFAIAAALFSDLGMDAHLLRVRWGQARLALARGDSERGVEELRNVWGAFEAKSMKPEWIRCGLELVEQLLKSGDSFRVRKICETLYGAALDAAMTESALDALEFLRTAARHSELTPAFTQYVRRHFDLIAADPRTPFQAPN